MPQTSRTNFDVPLEFVRHMIDLGRLFVFSALTASGSTPIVYRLKTGARHVGISIYFDAGAQTLFNFIEGVTITGNGTAAPLRNLNRNYDDDTLLSKLFTGATYTGGTIFKYNQAGHGTVPGTASSGDNVRGSGYILKPNTEYILLFTPTSADVNVEFELFETVR